VTAVVGETAAAEVAVGAAVVAVAAAVVAVGAAVVAVAVAAAEVGVGAAVVAVAAGVFVAAATAATTTVPVMLGWMLQWYVKVPAAVNVLANVAPVFILPESKTPGVSELTVCGMPASLFVQVTVSPTDTDTEAGLNAKLTMDTLWLAASASRAANESPKATTAAITIGARTCRRRVKART
jgi:hypothetical protein